MDVVGLYGREEVEVSTNDPMADSEGMGVRFFHLHCRTANFWFLDCCCQIDVRSS